MAKKKGETFGSFEDIKARIKKQNESMGVSGEVDLDKLAANLKAKSAPILEAHRQKLKGRGQISGESVTPPPSSAESAAPFAVDPSQVVDPTELARQTAERESAPTTDPASQDAAPTEEQPVTEQPLAEEEALHDLEYLKTEVARLESDTSLPPARRTKLAEKILDHIGEGQVNFHAEIREARGRKEKVNPKDPQWRELFNDFNSLEQLDARVRRAVQPPVELSQTKEARPSEESAAVHPSEKSRAELERELLNAVLGTNRRNLTIHHSDGRPENGYKFARTYRENGKRMVALVKEVRGGKKAEVRVIEMDTFLKWNPPGAPTSEEKVELTNDAQLEAPVVTTSVSPEPSATETPPEGPALASPPQLPTEEQAAAAQATKPEVPAEPTAEDMPPMATEGWLPNIKTRPPESKGTYAPERSRENPSVKIPVETIEIGYAENLARNAGVNTEREAMLAARQAFLAVEQNYYAKTSAVGRLYKEKIRGQKLEDTPEYKAYQKAQAWYGTKLAINAQARIKERYGDKDEAFQTKMYEKYLGVVRFNDVIIQGQKAREGARLEGLSEHKVNLFERSLGALGKANRWLDKKLTPNQKRLVYLVGSTAIATGVGAALGSTATLGVAGFAGLKILRRALGIVAGSYAGTKAGAYYEQTGGKKKAEHLKTARREGAVDLEAIEDFEKAYKEGSQGAIAKKRALVQALTAAAVAGGTSLGGGALVRFIEHMGGTAADALSNAGVHPPVQPNATNADQIWNNKIAPEPEVSKAEVPATATPASEISGTQATEIATPVEVIAKPGDGGIRLFAHLQENLRTAYPDGSANPQVQHLLEMKPEELAKEYGFFKPAHGESAVVFKGDTLRVTPEGNLEYDTPGKGPVTLTHDHEFKRYSHAPVSESVQAEQPASQPQPETKWDVSNPPSPEEMPAVDTSKVLEQHSNDWYITHSESPTENAASAAPSETPPASAAEMAVHFNSHNIAVDPAKATLYAGEKGTNIVHGGSLESRYARALAAVQKDHTAVVYFDSSSKNIFGKVTAHLTCAYWNPDTNSIQMPNEVMDPTLRGFNLPTEEDLYRRLDP